MPAFMKLGDIKGESQAKGFEDWFEILSMSNGASNDNRKLQFQDFNVTKATGKGTPPIYLACCSGQVFPDAIIVFTREADLEHIMEYRLQQARVTSIQHSGSGFDRPTEALSLSFSGIDIRQFIYRDDGRLDHVETMSWAL